MRSTGEAGSENPGLSSEKQSENLCHRKSKVSWGRLVRPGLVGPKSRPKGVDNGQQVNIPVPRVCVMSDGGVEKDTVCRASVVPVQASRGKRR